MCSYDPYSISPTSCIFSVLLSSYVAFLRISTMSQVWRYFTIADPMTCLQLVSTHWGLARTLTLVFTLEPEFTTKTNKSGRSSVIYDSRASVHVSWCGHGHLKCLRFRLVHWKSHQKRPGLHERTFYDTNLQKGKVSGVQRAHGERRARMESSATDGWGWTQKGRSRTFQSNLISFIKETYLPVSLCISYFKINFNIRLSLCPRTMHINPQPQGLIDPTSFHVCLWSTHFPTTCRGFLQKTGNVILWFTLRDWWIVKTGTMVNASELLFCKSICNSAEIYSPSWRVRHHRRHWLCIQETGVN